MENFVTTKTLIPIRHDGTDYDIGAELKLSQQDYKNLLNIQAIEPADANKSNLHNDDKNGNGTGDDSPAPASVELDEYAKKTNADQLAYLQSLGNEDFKCQAETLLQVSKSQAKAYINRRLKTLNEVVE